MFEWFVLLLYDAVTKTSTLSELGDEEAGSTDKGIVRLTKPERRAKLKQQRKEAKKLGKELEKVEEVQQTPQAAVLVLSNWSHFLMLLKNLTFFPSLYLKQLEIE